MITTVLGVHELSGIGKQSQKPYTMAPRVLVMTPLEEVDSPNFKRRGAGFEQLELECTPDVFEKLGPLVRTNPGRFELVLSPVRRKDVVTTLVTGFTPVKAAA